MYAVIRRMPVIAVDRLKPRITDDFLPNVAEKLPGFIAYYFLKLSDEELASVSLFETREDADNSIQVVHEWVRQNMADEATGAPVATSGEVIVVNIAKPQAFPGQMAA